MSTCFLLAHPADAEIRYTVSLSRPEQHLFHITVEVPDVKDHVDLQMAAWDALYEIRDFSSHVQRVTASANGRDVPIEKLDKLTWRVQASGTVKVSYDTFWDDPGPFSSQLNAEHAFINPAMILLYVPGRRAEKAFSSLHDVPSGWNVASASVVLIESMGGARKFTLEAPALTLSPTLPSRASHFEEFTIHDIDSACPRRHPRRRLQKARRRIRASQNLRLRNQTHGRRAYPEYTFIFHIGKAASGSGGGMEHANSTAIYIPSGSLLPNVSAHEFFHLWNVKRIRPASLEPVDRTREMYTRALWFAEGVTNTFSSYALVRTGLWSKQEFLHDLSQQITETRIPSRRAVAKRGAIQPRRLAGKIRALQSAAAQRFLLHEGPGSRLPSRHRPARPHGQSA